MKQKPYKNRMPQGVNLSTRIHEDNPKDARAQRRQQKLDRKRQRDLDWWDDFDNPA